jgi:hypothetical protein
VVVVVVVVASAAAVAVMPVCQQRQKCSFEV